jgi:ubiquinone/menaquinone biosynthesis C-methylase UbiE
MVFRYLHGYSERETRRLLEQSEILEELLHSDFCYPDGCSLLEVGCGVGAQTVLLAEGYPRMSITSFDISKTSLDKAGQLIARRGIKNVRFCQSDIFAPSFGAGIFDCIFVCFVLEHLHDPVRALVCLKSLLKPGGTIIVIEGDHGSCFWSPETRESRQVWQAMIDAQFALGHNPLIGRQLYPLLREAGFEVKSVVPKWVYTDNNNPVLADGVLNKIIVPMVETARECVLQTKKLDRKTWELGVRDLICVGREPDGTFFYTWFKGIGIKSGSRSVPVAG